VREGEHGPDGGIKTGVTKRSRGKKPAEGQGNKACVISLGMKFPAGRGGVGQRSGG